MGGGGGGGGLQYYGTCIGIYVAGFLQDNDNEANNKHLTILMVGDRYVCKRCPRRLLKRIQ